MYRYGCRIRFGVFSSFKKFTRIINALYSLVWGRNSSVSIAIRYGLDGPRIESRWGREFLHTSTSALGPTQPPIQWVPGLSRE